MDIILAVIIACEIGFWVFIVAGLIARYLLRWQRVGAALLLMTPVIDVVLLVAVILNLQSGGTATVFHGLAALYLGISVVYGRRIIAWADVRFAHWFNRGSAPVKKYGKAYAVECWKDVLRTTAAIALAAGILWILTTMVEDPTSMDALLSTFKLLGLWFAIDALWAISYTVWPKRPIRAT